ncbi:MAG: hypothetical protein IJA61_03595 [Clostridia bacterium]|nr:hypothetical protein [Clostridia bacterium]
MSKKISLIISVIVAFMGIILVSIFGKVPEYLLEKVKMEKLYFQDKNIVLDDGDKIYYFALSYGNMSLNVYDMIVYEPNNTTDISVSYTLSNYDIAKITQTGMLTFEEHAINSFTSLEVTIASQDSSNLSDKLIIRHINLKDKDSAEFDDFEI